MNVFDGKLFLNGMFKYSSSLLHVAKDIICSSKLIVFHELRSRKTVRFSEQIMSADNYLSIFSRQMEAIVYLYQLRKCKMKFDKFTDICMTGGIRHTPSHTNVFIFFIFNLYFLS